MIDVSIYEKIGECRYGKMVWLSQKKDNIVYLIQFGNDSYIGSSKNIRRRFSQYVPALTRGKYEAEKVQNAFNLNKGFDVYAIEFANADDLREREEYYLNLLHPTLNTRTTVSYMYREADPNTLNSIKKKEGFIGVQTKIPVSMYYRLCRQKELRGESIIDMVAQAISEWIDIQCSVNESFAGYSQVQPTTKKRAAFSPAWRLPHNFHLKK